mmetsp:Transcript_2870/g.2382  ORF Transcript_2870/g.2382 Transcript_2870/m.2382 type:complete len:94 (+) Transcript_2870:441-722(+)
MLEKIISLGCHLEGLEFHFCFIDTENMRLSSTREFKIKYLWFNNLELPQHSLLSNKDYIEHLMLAFENCSLKGSLEDFTVHSTKFRGFRYKKG